MDPETVQMLPVVELNVTVRPGLVVAARVSVGAHLAVAPGFGNVIVCEPLATALDAWTWRGGVVVGVAGLVGA